MDIRLWKKYRWFVIPVFGPGESNYRSRVQSFPSKLGVKFPHVRVWTFRTSRLTDWPVGRWRTSPNSLKLAHFLFYYWNTFICGIFCQHSSTVCLFVSRVQLPDAHSSHSDFVEILFIVFVVLHFCALDGS